MRCEELLPKPPHVGGSGSLSEHLPSGGAHGVVEPGALAERRRGTKRWRASEGRRTPKDRSAAEPAWEETTASCLIFNHSRLFCSGPPRCERWSLVGPSWLHMVSTRLPFKDKMTFNTSARLSGGERGRHLSPPPALLSGGPEAGKKRCAEIPARPAACSHTLLIGVM